MNSGNSIPEPLKEILNELVFLAQIRKGIKPNMNNKTFTSSDSWLGSIYRFISWESFNNAIKEINHTIDLAIKYIDEYRETEFIYLLVKRLAEARQGLSNMKVTYQDRPKCVAEISTILDNIDLQLRKYKDFLEKEKY